MYGQSPLHYAEKVLLAEWQDYTKVYALAEDPYGMLWLGTDKGLYRYDGRELTAAWRLFPDTLGLLSDDCGRLSIIDSNLWVGTIKEGVVQVHLKSGSFSHWSHQSIDSAGLPDPRITFIKSWPRFALTLVGTHLHGLVAIDASGTIVRHIQPSAYISVVNERSIDVITDAQPIPGTHTVALATLEGLVIYDWEADTLHRFLPDSSNTSPAADLTLNAQVFRTCVVQGDSVVWIGTWGGGLLRFHLPTHQFTLRLYEPDLPNDAYSNNIHILILLDDQTLLVPGTHSDAYLLDIPTGRFRPWLTLQYGSNPVSFYNVIKGQYGFWLSTAGSDVWKVDGSLSFWQSEIQPFTIDYTVVRGSTVYRLESDSVGNNYLAGYMDDSTIFRVALPQNPNFEDQFNRGLFLTPDGLVVVSNRDVWLYDMRGRILHTFPNDVLAAKAFNRQLPSIISSGYGAAKVWLGTKGSGMLTIDLTTHTIEGLHRQHPQFPIVHDYWITTFAVQGGVVWYGTEEGMGCITPDTAYTYPLSEMRHLLQGRDKALLKEIYDLQQISDNEWLLVSPKSIFQLHERNYHLDSLRPVWQADDWVDNFRSIHPVANRTYWVRTADLWYQWTFPDRDRVVLPLPEPVARYSRWVDTTGQPALQWNQVTLSAAITDRPLYAPMDLYLKEVRWGGTEPIMTLLEPDETIVLDYASNFFSFTAQFTRPIPRGYTLHYRLLGWDESWQPFRGGRASFSNLSPGYYTLEVVGRDLNGQEITPVFAQSLQVRRPYWMTWWFLGGVSILIVGALVLAYRFRIGQVRKAERLRKSFLQQIQELEVKALRAQMNPHFMFNCLNSIRNLMLKDEQDDAVEYITKFARLLRLILQHSKQDMITLQEELEGLELYLELEKLRLDEKLTYSIEVDATIQPNLQQLPPMICQPYVENAIWHGLLNKNGGGTVVIKAAEENETLVISIEDDGVGRQMAQEIESRNQTAKRKSYGMSLIKDRLNIMRDWKHVDTTVEIQDLYQNNLPSGTRVILKLHMHDQSHLNR